MLLIKNIGRLQTPVGSFPHKGIAQSENLKVDSAAILIKDGIIEEIFEEGQGTEISDANLIDATGCLVTPGLVDCHTHLVFGGYRQNEIPLKLSGASYLEILQSGGGILDTVKKTRDASVDELYDKSFGFLDEMMSFGVTTCEAKSGYGLNFREEIKQLEVICRLDDKHKMDIVPTFMGGHAVPPEFKDKPDEYINYICENMIPYVAGKGLAEFCDVFCEDSVFTPEQSKKLLLCAKEHGLFLKIHADEIEEIGGALLAADVGAISAEHLIATGNQGINALANGGVIAALLPQTSLYLGKNFANARGMINAGVPVALATDFNPGSCPSLNLQLSINLGYLKYKMTPEEILCAVTINAAAAIKREKEVGSIEKGKQADLVIWNAPDMEMLCYRMGSNLAKTVIKKGEIQA